MKASYGMLLLVLWCAVLLFGVLAFSLLSLLNSFDGVNLLPDMDGRAMEAGTSSAEELLLALEGVLLRREGESAIVSNLAVCGVQAKSRAREWPAMDAARRNFHRRRGKWMH